MTLEEKLEIIEDRVLNLDIHINILIQDIELNPGLDVAEKPTRSSVLEQFNREKSALIREKELLTNQG